MRDQPGSRLAVTTKDKSLKSAYEVVACEYAFGLPGKWCRLWPAHRST